MDQSFTQVSSSLTNKHLTMLEIRARNKHTSLFSPFVNYGRKKFYNICPCPDLIDHRVFQEPFQVELYIKKIYTRNLQL